MATENTTDNIFSGLRVVDFASFIAGGLPPYVKQFLQDCPNVNVNVQYRRANEVYEDHLLQHRPSPTTCPSTLQAVFA